MTLNKSVLEDITNRMMKGERERSDESTDNENGFNKARRVIRVVPARLGLKAVGKARLFAASAFQN